MKKRKVVLIGTGFVGMSFAYSLFNQGGVNELILVDILKEKAEGEALDISHGLAYCPNNMEVTYGNYKDCKDADIVVITAGIAQKPGQTRLELVETNSKIAKDITKNIMKSGFNGIIVVATNPVDIITYVVQKTSKLDSSKVIGTGTMLDTARLRYMLGEELDVNPIDINAIVMGEHGDSSFVPWEYCNIGCKNILDIAKQNNKSISDLELIRNDVKNAAYEIIEKKKATYYGIGMALTKLVKAILDDERTILTVSTYLNGKYNEEDIYVGVPAVITGGGVREILEISLNEADQKKLDDSCQLLKETLQKITI